jgi:adenosylmethionine-8-amino-7-oxononanoate aminotransferase
MSNRRFPGAPTIAYAAVMTRPTRVFHRAPRNTFPVGVSGHGVYLIDAEGRRYLDASGGAAVSCLGHGHPKVIEAIKRQAERLAYAHTAFFTTEPAERLAEFLVGRAPPGLSHVYFVSGGSEAIEAALKLARQYFVEIGEPERSLFIARRQSYHGNTLGALAIGGNAWRREPFLPLLAPAVHVSPCYAYRDQRAGESEEAYGDRLVAEFEAAIVEAGPNRVAAFVAETVVGATLGAVPPVAGYFAKIKAVCERHGVLMILDEVMSGMGRTGYLFACEEDGVAPDIVTIAKGLGGGYQPIGAALCSGRIYEAIVAGSGFFQHGHTYLGHAIACAAALAVQETVEEEDLLANVHSRGKQLREGLAHTFAAHRHVGDVRGRGLLVGVELVEDRTTKAPFDPARRIHARVKSEAMARGLMVYPMGGTVDGRRGDHVLLAPPFIASAADIDEIVARLKVALDAATAA